MAVTTSILRDNNHKQKIKVSWTSDAGGAASGPISLTGLIFCVETDPGSGPPTANYDITLVNPLGLDKFQGLLNNRHTTNNESVEFNGLGALTNGPPLYVDDEFTFTVANAGNATSGVAYIYLAQ